MEIDLDILTDNGKVHNLAGKERGEAARSEFGLDCCDREGAPVTVNIPKHVYAISSSFFLGLFSPSVEMLGSSDKFLEKYHFHAAPEIMPQIINGLARCSFKRGPLMKTAG